MGIDEARGIAAKIWCEPNHRRKVMDKDLCESIAQLLVDQSGVATARKTINDALNEDTGFHKAYVATLACVIYDDQNGDAPANLQTMADCNVLADALLRRTFGT